MVQVNDGKWLPPDRTHARGAELVSGDIYIITLL